VNWQWFHRLGSPRWFYEKTESWMFWLGLASIISMTMGVAWGLGFAPADFKQGNSYRIIFIHVPGSFVAMAGYYAMAICGAVGLVWRMKLSFMVMKAIAPIGAVLTFVSLVTGAIWGKPTWGTWWEWDARITSMLILFFLYLGIIALQEAYRNQDAADKTSAILALVGMVNIPIIYKSVDWWYTLHQPATLKLTESSSIAPSMAYPLIVMILAFYFCFIWLVLAFSRLEVLKREKKTQWVRQLVLKSMHRSV
jgi:heme exporter protein C